MTGQNILTPKRFYDLAVLSTINVVSRRSFREEFYEMAQKYFQGSFPASLAIMYFFNIYYSLKVKRNLEGKSGVKWSGVERILIFCIWGCVHLYSLLHDNE